MKNFVMLLVMQFHFAPPSCDRFSPGRCLPTTNRLRTPQSYTSAGLQFVTRISSRMSLARLVRLFLLLKSFPHLNFFFGRPIRLRKALLHLFERFRSLRVAGLSCLSPPVNRFCTVPRDAINARPIEEAEKIFSHVIATAVDPVRWTVDRVN